LIAALFACRRHFLMMPLIFELYAPFLIITPIISMPPPIDLLIAA